VSAPGGSATQGEDGECDDDGGPEADASVGAQHAAPLPALSRRQLRWRIVPVSWTTFVPGT
jgi:hypothetical protein